MSSIFGDKIKISIFGESHSAGIGVVIDGLPAGEKIDEEKIYEFMKRRAPGKRSFSTARNEADKPKILSGIKNSVICGSPVCAVIENTDTRSGDYENLIRIPRPSHSDYPAFVKYRGANDISGGGHFSGRLTAPLCFAGALCSQLLEKRGVFIGAHIYSIGGIYDDMFHPSKLIKDTLLIPGSKEFPVISDEKGKLMLEKIEYARKNLDSVGGIIECGIVGLPAGIGDPMFDGIENKISRAVFGIPAVKGIEFGAGFKAASMFGSEANDAYYYDENGDIRTKTNNNGGISGGISNGMPVIFRTAVKPTPSIAKKQDSVDLVSCCNTELEIKGRHDPCIVPRAVPAVEAAAAAVILDMILSNK